MTHTASKWASDLRSAEYNFLPTVVEALEQFNNGNTTDLAKLLCITHGKKSGIIKVVEGDRMAYAAPLKRILAKALDGVEAKFDKKKNLASLSRCRIMVALILNRLRACVYLARLASLLMLSRKPFP